MKPWLMETICKLFGHDWKYKYHEDRTVRRCSLCGQVREYEE